MSQIFPVWVTKLELLKSHRKPIQNISTFSVLKKSILFVRIKPSGMVMKNMVKEDFCLVKLFPDIK